MEASRPEELDIPNNYSTWPCITYFGGDMSPDLKIMAEVITDLKLWDWFRTESPPPDKGYIWWGHQNVSRISNAIPNSPHSGGSFATAMRCMQAIARKGFRKWYDECTKQCPICLDDINSNSSIVWLKCRHKLHESCYSHMLESGVTSCPYRCEKEDDKEVEEDKD